MSLLVKGGAALAALAVPAALHGTRVFSFTDPAITESSGLVDLGSTMVTTNDSGGDPLVFVVDDHGRTVGRTTYTSSVLDTEALAPAGAHAVWVGDIGDNDEVRPTVQVYRVPVGRGDRTVHAPAYDLVYPDGPHDAESLLYGPDKRLRIVTKGVLGGAVYVAPERLDPNRPNRLRKGPQVDVWATDAALLPGGGYVIVRGYGSALVATYPQFRPLGYVELPAEPQGEGISVSRAGRIRLSSEGEHSAVLQIGLPASIRAKIAPPRVGPVTTTTDPAATSEPDGGSPWPWILGGSLAVGFVGWLLTRRRT